MKQYQSLISQLPNYDLKNQRVFLRADLNVLSDGKITNDYRLKALLPTIDLILKKGGKIILATHIGRPTEYDAQLTTYHLVSWLSKNGYQIDFADSPDQAIIKSHESPHSLIMLENLRFFAGEQNGDERFAKLLAASADYYVNDAFGLIHRDDTSITLLPELFPPDERTIGLLIEKEIKELNKLINQPKKPFVLILGGAKLKTKIPLIRSLTPLVDQILLCPALVFTFLKADGKEVGKSLIDATLIDEARAIINEAMQNNTKVALPVDYQVAANSIDGPLRIVNADEFSSTDVGVSIGPKTVDQFGTIIGEAQTVFFNGVPGFLDRPETLEGVHGILNALNKSNGYTVIGGGDTVAAAFKLDATQSIDFISTGGGATLAYLAGERLPGLLPFLQA